MLKNSASSSGYRPTEKERANLKILVDYSSVQSLPEIWSKAAAQFSNRIALHDPHSTPEVVLTYSQVHQQIQQFASGLQALGVQSGDRVAIFADNSPRWFVADQAIMTAGAADAVRSSQAEKEELLFILADSGSKILIVEDNKTFKKLSDRLPDLAIELIVLLSDEEPLPDTIKVINFSTLMAMGENRALQPVDRKLENLATLIYTSGTTGKPKGVMLTHGNLLHEITTLGAVIQPQPGDKALTILPTWHSFGRIGEYFLLPQGCTQIYTNIRHIKKDFKTFQPQYMVGVPRLWESIYEAVQKKFREQPDKKQKLINTLMGISQKYVESKRILQGLTLDIKPRSPIDKVLAGIQTVALFPIHAIANQIIYKKVQQEATGGKLKYVISGGGSLAMHLENFYEIMGLEVLVGYGLTETSPVLTARRYWYNLRGSSGKPIPGTEIKIVDPETRQTLGVGKTGLVMARGPQIMQGYYQNPGATAKAIDAQGWFDTGDLGWLTAANDIVLTGRAKDTIVLTNGENIEPQPIEDACLRSPYIDQIMLVGQDERSLGALIVPNLEALQKWAISKNFSLRLPANVSKTLETPEIPGLQPIEMDNKVILDLFRQEITREAQNRPGYRPDDRIGPFKLILESFSIENGMMTQTLKIRRPVVMERYRDMINGMFDK